MTPAQQALADLEAAERGVTVRRVRFWLVAVATVALYLVAGHLAQIDPGRLATGLPKIWRWIAQAWPPAIEEMPLFLQRTAETVAMAAIGTTLATVLAIPAAAMASMISAAQSAAGEISRGAIQQPNPAASRRATSSTAHPASGCE